MEKSDKICVLSSLGPFLRFLRAYNAENFGQSNPIHKVKNLAFACFVTIFIALMPILIALTIWCLIDKKAALQNIVVAAPLLFTVFQLFIKIVVLVARNGDVSKTIQRLQIAIDQRK